MHSNIFGQVSLLGKAYLDSEIPKGLDERQILEFRYYGHPQRTTPLILSELPSVKQVACNKTSIAILTKDGDVYISGELDIDDSPGGDNSPKKYSGIPKIQFIAAGNAFEFVLMDVDGQMISIGTDFMNPDPRQFLQGGANIRFLSTPFRVKTLAIGFNAMMFVDEFGRVFYSGRNRHQDSIVKDLKKLPPIESLCMGLSHFALVSNSGELFTGGQNFDGQLGHGVVSDERYAYHSIKKVHDIPKVKQVSVSSVHTAFVTTDYQLYTFGSGSDNLLGDRLRYDHKVTIPTRVENIPPVVQVSCTNRHTTFLTNSGQVMDFDTSNRPIYCISEGKEYGEEVSLDPILVPSPSFVTAIHRGENDFAMISILNK